MRKLISTILILFSVLPFKTIAQTSKKIVLDEKISFSLPYEWKIIADEPIEDYGWYFSTINSLEGATGLITISWINQVSEIDKTILAIHENMKVDDIYKDGGIEFTGLEPVELAGMEGTTSRYIAYVKNTRIEGRIYCFICKEKTLSIIFQSGYSDMETNKKTLDLLIGTFVCE